MTGEELRATAHEQTSRHIRAYMAGVAIPSATVFVVSVFVAARFLQIPIAIERALIFPMAANPMIWGLWNVFYVGFTRSRRIPIGWHGAALPMLLIPIGLLLARHLELSFVTPKGCLVVLAPMMLAYFVIWKYLISRLNNVLGLFDS